jgi:SHS2 domain-containing protein
VIEFVDHTGELELLVSDATLEGLYAEAVRGLAREVAEEEPAGGEEERALELHSSGPDTLLADLLNEVVFLMETEGFLPSRLVVHEVAGGRLRGTLAGRAGLDVRPLVKAATYHDLRVWREGGLWRARVILDV